MRLEKTTSLLSLLSITFTVLAILIMSQPKQKVELIEIQSTTYGYWYASLGMTKLRMMLYDIEADIEVTDNHLTEEPSEEFNCLFYATEPIGKYYITAYNDEETACKITASGAKCHEGTITTCAADVPKYFHFGDIIEVDGRLFRVEDTGSAVKKRHIDLFFDSYSDMKKYGSNYQNIYKVSFPFGVPKDL